MRDSFTSNTGYRRQWMTLRIIVDCQRKKGGKIEFSLKILSCIGPPTTIHTKLMSIRSFTYKEDDILQTHGVLVLIEKSWPNSLPERSLRDFNQRKTG